MALPPLKTRTVDYQPSYGITLTISPSTQAGADLVLERTQVSSSGTWNQIGRLGVKNGAPVTYVDQLPNDGVRRFYRAYEAEAGWNNSTYTKITSGYPDQLSQGYIQVPVTMLPVNAPLSLSTQAIPIYGTSTNPAYVKKVLRVPAMDFGGQKSSDTYSKQGGTIACQSTNVQRYVKSAILPTGAIVVKSEWHVNKTVASTKSQIKVELVFSSADGVGATLFNSTLGAVGGVHTIATSSFASPTMSTAAYLWSRVTMKSTVAATNITFFYWWDLTYKVNTLSQSI